LENQPARKNVIAGMVKKYMTTIRSLSKGCSEVTLQIGMYKNAAQVAANANTGIALNTRGSASQGMMVSLDKSFTMSASG